MGVIAPENTLAAYRAAIALGLNYVETDPRPTKDGVLVNVHDTTVDRTTDGHGEVAEMTLKEIRKLHIKASRFPGDFSCERVPTLREILETCRGRVHVLVDANKTDRVDLLVGDIVATNSLEWAIFDTSSIKKIQRALELEPRLHVMARVKDEKELKGVLDELADHPPVIIEVSHGSTKQVCKAIHQAGHRCFVDVFAYDASASVAHEPDPSIYAYPFDNGADIVQTDRPGLVLEYLGRL